MVTLVVTIGVSSLDLYSERLAKYLPSFVPRVYTTIYHDLAEHFNASLLSCTEIKSLCEDIIFIKELNKLNGILHLPNHHLGRYGVFLKKPYIITVHDLVRYLDTKGYGPIPPNQGFLMNRPNLRDRIYLNLDIIGIKKAIKIIAVSHTTKRDIVRYLKVPEERIDVIYEGVDHKIYKPVKERPIDYPYVLYVGTEYPRKNFITLLKAFKKLKRDKRFSALKLVKVGRAGRLGSCLRRYTLKAIKTLKLKNDVIFAGYVTEKELVKYYSNAECFVLPSLYEGFGLPVIEAMACNCPVICSNSSALSEVAGDAAIKINPYNVNELTKALKRVLTDDRLRNELIRKGSKRSRMFSWERTARETLRVYREIDEYYH